MENLTLVSSSKASVVLGSSSIPRRDTISSKQPLFGLFKTRTRTRTNTSAAPIERSTPISASYSPRPRRISKANVVEKLGRECFASITSSGSQETSSVGVNPPLSMPPPPSHVGSPLFWIGVGVGLSALFSWKYAMQQAFKTLMGQMDSQNNQFSNASFSRSPPFPFPTPQAAGPASSASPAASDRTVTVDVAATNVKAEPNTDVKADKEIEKEPKKYAFVDVSPEETLQKSPFESLEESTETDSTKGSQFGNQASQNGTASKPGVGASEWSSSTRNENTVLSVDALEKMMEDPTVQKMVFPNNMGGSTEWDNRMMDSLKSFDLSSPEVKQQFDQIGLTPEEVISKIMANPDVAMAFQNPRVQAAIMDCSQNPLSIGKYQNDKEVMDVFNKISELFPGVTGPS
ncbi:hypothetical protein RJ639_046973 [Escallonia herrerae]|uniref:Protein TIC 40, chloroplastic n=1 Tax=Escallonia herrerae TaxID=1293975 RepID=A0AA88W7K8_9ASTE|nr:hypothetical protein RJ639_046973 [Escallonia herrerae]